MNLASDKEKVYEFACTVIREDIARMDALGIENIVFHPGSHTGIGIEAGIRNIIAGLDQAITGDENIMVLLETMTGKGTEIGAKFEHLRAIRDGVRPVSYTHLDVYKRQVLQRVADCKNGQ